MTKYVELPCYQPPLPQRPYRRIVGSGRVKAVNHKHEAVGVSLNNRYSILAELNRDNQVTGSAVCGDSDDSTKQGIMVHEEEVVLNKGRCQSGIANQAFEVNKVSKKRTHFLAGDSM